MSELLTSARPYAKALFRSAKDKNMLEKYFDMLQNLNLAVSEKNIKAIIIKTKEGSVVHKRNNLTDEAETISFGTKNSITSVPDFILISTAFLNFEVSNQ